MPTSLFQSSGDLTADRRYAFALDLAARGDLAAAADLLMQTVELAPNFTAAWFALGEAQEKLGHHSEAITAFRRVNALDPQDRHGAALHLMRLGARNIGNMPQHYVREVFDQYAARFDQALTQGLAYRGPELLLTAVRRACEFSGHPLHFGLMLDLGCGTGLGGMAFRPFCDRMVGIDISSNMVAQASGKGIYDELSVAEIMDYLCGEAAHARFDLVLAADVFAYFPDLTPVVGACANVLQHDGILAFTVESHPGEGVILGDKLRFAHSGTHVRETIAAVGLTLTSLDPASTRNEGGVAVPGRVVIATRS